MPTRSSSSHPWRDAGRLGRLEIINSSLALVGGLVAFLIGVFTHSLLFLYTAPFAWMLLMLLIRHRRRRLMRRLVSANNSAVCWECWYPLTDAQQNRCPECGVVFDLDKLRVGWAEILYPG